MVKTFKINVLFELVTKTKKKEKIKEKEGNGNEKKKVNTFSRLC